MAGGGASLGQSASGYWVQNGTGGGGRGGDERIWTSWNSVQSWIQTGARDLEFFLSAADISQTGDRLGPDKSKSLNHSGRGGGGLVLGLPTLSG